MNAASWSEPNPPIGPADLSLPPTQPIVITFTTVEPPATMPETHIGG
jgi:hypothetical protein